MWAQTWSNIENIVKPYNDTPIFDVTQAMIDQVRTRTNFMKTKANAYKNISSIEL